MTSPSAPPPVGGEATEKESTMNETLNKLIQREIWLMGVSTEKYDRATAAIKTAVAEALGSLRQKNEALRIEDERKHFMLAASRSIVGKLEADKAQLADLVATHERVQLRGTAERDLAQSRLTAALTENEALRQGLREFAEAIGENAPLPLDSVLVYAALDHLLKET